MSNKLSILFGVLRRNGITLCLFMGTIVLLVIYIKYYDVGDTDIQTLRNKSIIFEKTKVQLSQKSIDQAQENEKKLKHSFRKILSTFRARYPKPTPIEQYKENKFVDILSRYLDRLIDQFKVMNIKLGSRIKKERFYFANFLDRNVSIPRKEQVMIFKNMMLVKDILSYIIRSQVTGLEDLKIDVKTKDDDKLALQLGYKKIPLSITLNGAFPSLQKFISLLAESPYCFILRDVTLERMDSFQQGLKSLVNNTGGNRQIPPPLWQKANALRAIIVFEYLDFYHE